MLNQKLMGKVGEDKTYIEDVFSTYLYTGNGSTQTINNGIDLAGKGGLVWVKTRSGDYSGSHQLSDTLRGSSNVLFSNGANAQFYRPNGLTSFNSNGFSLGTDVTHNGVGTTYASWTFRKASKFFDVVTYTGNGVSGRTINHNLGIAPGMIFVKCTSDANDWAVYHTSLSAYDGLYLNYDWADGNVSQWANTTPTASAFTVGGGLLVNGAGKTYVAYLFAHDTTTDGWIQCGSSSTASVTLGWEPQYVLVKRTDISDDWYVFDTMRGLTSLGGNALRPNTSGAESADFNFTINSTGFYNGWTGGTYIYMAIRRGPMRTPTDGTKVFKPVVQNGTVAAGGLAYNFGFPPDAVIEGVRNGAGFSPTSTSRLIGNFQFMVTASTGSETGDGGYRTYTQSMQGMTYGISTNFASFGGIVGWGFKRAPGFFDVVCYTGTGSARTVNHNLGVAPELVITKVRSTNLSGWQVGTQFTDSSYVFSYLNQTNAGTQFNYNLWFSGKPSATSFSIDSTSGANSSGQTYVTYLFASCPGVSKVGSYTGNGSSQTIDCGFTNGARFFLVKATSTTGNWWVYDSARGIVSSTDPVLALNSTAAEVTSADAVDPESTGIIVNQEATCSINANGVSYIYLAIA